MYLKKNRKIYLVMGFTDMRKQINGLAQIAEAKKPKELLSGNYFVFRLLLVGIDIFKKHRAMHYSTVY